MPPAELDPLPLPAGEPLPGELGGADGVALGAGALGAAVGLGVGGLGEGTLGESALAPEAVGRVAKRVDVTGLGAAGCEACLGGTVRRLGAGLRAGICWMGVTPITFTGACPRAATGARRGGLADWLFVAVPAVNATPNATTISPAASSKRRSATPPAALFAGA
ncbi:MAG: hypothetical protein ACR2MK_09060 [Solirubrobacteraceae bacterium]